MKKNLLKQLVAIPFFAAFLASSGSALAALIYETGFEPPAYVPGTLAGQNGWFFSLVGQVQGTTVLTGTQAVAYDSAGVSGQNLAVHGLTYNSVGNPEKVVRMQIDMRIDDEAGAPSHWDALAVSGNAGFIGQIIVDPAGNAVLGLASTTTGSVAVTFGAWHHYELLLDFSDGSMDAFVDGIFIGSGPMATASTTLGVLFIGISGAPAGAGDVAYFDNLSVTSVPVPGTIALLGLGLAGLGYGRRSLQRRRTAAF